MGCLAVLAVALRLRAKSLRKDSIGADDILIVVGLVRFSLTLLKIRLQLTTERSWHSACAFATLLGPQTIGLGTMSFTSSLVL